MAVLENNSSVSTGWSLLFVWHLRSLCMFRTFLVFNAFATYFLSSVAYVAWMETPLKCSIQSTTAWHRASTSATRE